MITKIVLEENNLTNTKPAHSTQFENLKTLKSKLMPQIADFSQVLKGAKEQLSDIGFAIQKKQKSFEEQRLQEVATKENETKDHQEQPEVCAQKVVENNQEKIEMALLQPAFVYL